MIHFCINIGFPRIDSGVSIFWHHYVKENVRSSITMPGFVSVNLVIFGIARNLEKECNIQEMLLLLWALEAIEKQKRGFEGNTILWGQRIRSFLKHTWKTLAVQHFYCKAKPSFVAHESILEYHCMKSSKLMRYIHVCMIETHCKPNDISKHQGNVMGQLTTHWGGFKSWESNE